MNPSSVKTRHYAALSSRLRVLKQNLEESETQFSLLAEQLDAMATMGVTHGAQFMAVSRLVDEDLEKAAQLEAQLAAQHGTEQPTGQKQ